jgi:hypothetical protein
MFELFAEMIGVHLNLHERRAVPFDEMRERVAGIESVVASLEGLAIDEQTRVQIVDRLRESAKRLSLVMSEPREIHRAI